LKIATKLLSGTQSAKQTKTTISKRADDILQKIINNIIVIVKEKCKFVSRGRADSV
jgi:hypothetical protein